MSDQQVAGEQVEVLVHPTREYRWAVEIDGRSLEPQFESTSAALRAARVAAPPRARIVLRDAYRRHTVVRFSGS